MAKGSIRTQTERDIRPDESVNDDDLGAEVAEGEAAITNMVAHEQRRDATYKTGGDDHDPGIDSEIDSNAPKELQLPPNKGGKT